MMRPAATSEVKMIATQGVLRVAWTAANGLGRTPSRDIPYMSREAMIMLIRAPFDSAKRPIAEKIFVSIPSGPCSTTSRSGPEEFVRSDVGTTAEAPIVTSR